MKLASLSNAFIASPNTFIALQSHSPKTFKYFSLYTCNDGRHISIEEKIVRATVLSVILLVGLALNLVVILYTICHPKSLKQSAIILLFASSVVNLDILLSFIPLQIINSFTEEWVFGNSKEGKILCQINGFFVGLGGATNHILALISVDRFFSLIKPLVYKQYFKPWLASLMLVIVFIIVLTQSVINIVYDRIEYGTITNVCVSRRNATLVITIYSGIVSVLPFIVIVVTTLWTFLSTHHFIKSDHQRRVDAIGSVEEEAREIQDNLYAKQIKKLFGMFSLLMISQLMSVLPLVLVVSLTNINVPLPSAYLFTTAILIYFGCISNPIIQSYFRKDLKEFYKKNYDTIMGRCKCSNYCFTGP